MFRFRNIIALSTAVLAAACAGNGKKADGYGNFEATEIIVSAQATGTVIDLRIREGQQVHAGDTVAFIDCDEVALQKAQAEASLQALDSKTMDFQPEADVYAARLKAEDKRLATLHEQRRVLEVEQARIEKLVRDEAVPAKQLDDINGKVAVLNREIDAAESSRDVVVQQVASLKRSTSDKNTSILSDRAPLQKQVARIGEQLDKCTIANPVDGTVLDVYLEEYELATVGKPVYKVADLTTMQLRIYLSATQLPEVTPGQTVDVRIDHEGGMKSYNGTIIRIASEAEFTPKIIQTREERVNLVYAAIVEVQNDGAIKIGMPGEVWLTKDRQYEEE